MQLHDMSRQLQDLTGTRPFFSQERKSGLARQMMDMNLKAKCYNDLHTMSLLHGNSVLSYCLHCSVEYYECFRKAVQPLKLHE